MQPPPTVASTLRPAPACSTPSLQPSLQAPAGPAHYPRGPAASHRAASALPFAACAPPVRYQRPTSALPAPCQRHATLYRPLPALTTLYHPLSAPPSPTTPYCTSLQQPHQPAASYYSQPTSLLPLTPSATPSQP
eukprot:CAMPEP_0119491852 /NCGR_PEP_ID=MMETSP1344-20130328/16593_1 /TAXON_ID=236787 /ORGANISM="Florenciella parvula, Strain CCMP2471" /LENGTH=134 /DNA_ID=CAMNT_0007527141 /DNA_START=129 /DNA_END=533 /DNA_ORIENTATION=+